MKKTTLWFAAMVIFSGIFMVKTQESFAIGFWHGGIVTKAPWNDKYTYIEIDDVRYTIMDDAKIVEVYEKKGAFYKDKINVRSIQNKHELVFKSEGNRIYNIEKAR